MKRLINYIEYTNYRSDVINDIFLDYDKLPYINITNGIIKLKHSVLVPYVSKKHLINLLSMENVNYKNLNIIEMKEKLSSNTTIYKYLLELRISVEKDNKKKESLYQTYEFINFINTYGMELRDFFTKGIVVTEKMNTMEFKQLFYEICVVNNSTNQIIDENTINNINHLQELINKLFDLMEENQIYFRNEMVNTIYLKKMLSNSFEARLNSNQDYFITTPFSLRFKDTNLSVKVIENDNELLLSDNKEVIDYLNSELYLKTEDYYDKIIEIIEKYEAKLIDGEIIMNIANITNPVTMERNFSRFIELLFLLSNINIIK